MEKQKKIRQRKRAINPPGKGSHVMHDSSGKAVIQLGEWHSPKINPSPKLRHFFGGEVVGSTRPTLATTWKRMDNCFCCRSYAAEREMQRCPPPSPSLVSVAASCNHGEADNSVPFASCSKSIFLITSLFWHVEQFISKEKICFLPTQDLVPFL